MINSECYDGRVARILPRLITPVIEAALATSPVVILEGGRATGKSTVCDDLVHRHGWAPRIDLSDPNARATLRLDPDRFLAAQPAVCVLDEAQLEPELTLWVKRQVDARRSAGQFLITGSARLGRDQLGGSDPLAGRSVRLRLSSMTRAEREHDLRGAASGVERAFGEGWSVGDSGRARGQVQLGRWAGGLPSIAGVLTDAPVADWERATAAYVEAVLPLGAGEQRADLGRLLRTFRYFAANSGQIVNYARAASELGSQAPTVKSHLEILESGFLLRRAEAERPLEHRVVTAHPRVFASDVGLAAWASRARLGSPPATTLGALTETDVAHDLMAQADASRDRIQVRHWRDTRTQREVDLLLVHPDGRYVPVEAKASTTVGPGDTQGLVHFVRAHAGRCARAVLVYEGTRVVDLTPSGSSCQILAVPRILI